MNQDQVAGILRIVVPAVCTWLAAKGFSAFGDAGVVAQITAVAVALAAIAWSFLRHTDAAKLEAAANVDPQVEVKVPQSLVNTNLQIANLVDNASVPNVVRKDSR